MATCTCEYDGKLTTYVFGSRWEQRWEYRSPSLQRAIRAFYVRTVFPHTYSTTPLDSSRRVAPHELGLGHYLWTASEPGAVVEVCVIPQSVPDTHRRQAAQRAKEAGEHYFEGDLVATRNGDWAHDRVVVARIPIEAPDGDDAGPALLQAQMALAGSSASTALQPAGVDTGLQTRRRSELELNALGMTERIAEIERMKNDLQQQRYELQRQIEGMRKELERRLEHVWMIELFLGTQEQVTLLRDGAPAPASTPITVCQRVLCMDEELAVYTWLKHPNRIGSFTWRNLHDFDAWLLQDPQHLDAIFPYEKGIVGLRVRRKQYSLGREVHPLVQVGEDEANEMTYILVRNGEQLYRLWVDVSLWPRLFSSDEDVARWCRLADKGGERDKEQGRKEFMRYIGGLMVLEGLLKRSDLLQPLPVPDLSCFDNAHSGYFCMVRDGEDRVQLTDGTDPLAHLTWDRYRKWLVGQLRDGLRVIWLGPIDGPEGDERRNALKIRTGLNTVSSWPLRNGVYILEGDGEKDGRWWSERTGWSFLYQPGDTVYSSDWYHGRGEHERARRVRFITTARECLPLDLCSWRVLEHLLNDRSQRHAYADFFGAVFGWWKNMKEEQQRESPFVSLALRQAGLEPTEWNVAWGHRLVRWWKMKTQQHRDLGEDEPKALRMVVKALRAGRDHEDDPEVQLMSALSPRRQTS